MGYDGIKTMMDRIDGKTVDKKIETAIDLVTKEKMSDASIKELLAPEGR